MINSATLEDENGHSLVQPAGQRSMRRKSLRFKWTSVDKNFVQQPHISDRITYDGNPSQRTSVSTTVDSLQPRGLETPPKIELSSVANHGILLNKDTPSKIQDVPIVYSSSKSDEYSANSAGTDTLEDVNSFSNEDCETIELKSFENTTTSATSMMIRKTEMTNGKKNSLSMESDGPSEETIRKGNNVASSSKEKKSFHKFMEKLKKERSNYLDKTTKLRESLAKSKHKYSEASSTDSLTSRKMSGLSCTRESYSSNLDKASSLSSTKSKVSTTSEENFDKSFDEMDHLKQKAGMSKVDLANSGNSTSSSKTKVPRRSESPHSSDFTTISTLCETNEPSMHEHQDSKQIKHHFLSKSFESKEIRLVPKISSDLTTTPINSNDTHKTIVKILQPNPQPQCCASNASEIPTVFIEVSKADSSVFVEVPSDNEYLNSRGNLDSSFVSSITETLRERSTTDRPTTPEILAQDKTTIQTQTTVWPHSNPRPEEQKRHSQEPQWSESKATQTLENRQIICAGETKEVKDGSDDKANKVDMLLDRLGELLTHLKCKNVKHHRQQTSSSFSSSTGSSSKHRPQSKKSSNNSASQSQNSNYYSRPKLDESLKFTDNFSKGLYPSWESSLGMIDTLAQSFIDSIDRKINNAIRSGVGAKSQFMPNPVGNANCWRCHNVINPTSKPSYPVNTYSTGLNPLLYGCGHANNNFRNKQDYGLVPYMKPAYSFQRHAEHTGGSIQPPGNHYGQYADTTLMNGRPINGFMNNNDYYHFQTNHFNQNDDINGIFELLTSDPRIP